MPGPSGFLREPSYRKRDLEVTSHVITRNSPNYYAQPRHATHRTDGRRLNAPLVVLNLMTWCYAAAAGIGAIT
jgi:hypothetical protein